MFKRNVLLAVAAVMLIGAVFVAGYVAAKGPVNQPKTLIHHVTLKWKAEVSDTDKQKVITDLLALLSELDGVRNVWVKAVKVQPRDYSQTFVVEFENEQALKAYADHPNKKAWNDFYYNIRETSYNCVTTN